MYAPVARMSSVRMLISKAVHEDLTIRQLDIPTAFLNGEVKSEIYIKLPQGLKTQSRNNVLRLKKALYGMAESPRCWNEKIDQFAIQEEFNRSHYDYCLYYKYNCWLLIYVDDIILVGDVQSTIQGLKREFNAKDLGEMKMFLGMEIERGKDILTIKQTKLIEKILKRFNMEDCIGAWTPMEKNLQLQEKEEKIKVPYRELIGSLMYLTVTSRPDLAYSVSYLSRYLDKPSQQTWLAGKRILRYLKQTKARGLIFKKSKSKVLRAYSDADWAGDKNDRKSVSGSIIYYGQNPVTWFSRKQKCVALSTAESEYIAAAQTAREILNLIGIRRQLGEDDEAKILMDNQSAICMAKSFENSNRMKHIDISVHIIKDLVHKEIITVEFVSSNDNYADLMTKSLCKDKFYSFVNNMLS